MNYKIRELENSDYYKGFLDLINVFTEHPKYISFEDFKNHSEKITDVYIIEDNNVIIATGKILFEYKFHKNLSIIAHIEDIIVKENYRNKGLGKLMISYLIKLCEEKKVYKIILNCSKENILFYEKCGFSHKNYEMSKYYI